MLNLGHQRQSLFPQTVNDSLAVLEAAFLLHVLESISLDFFVGCLLLENVNEDTIRGVGMNGVNNGEGEFPLGEILAETL